MCGNSRQKRSACVATVMASATWRVVVALAVAIFAAERGVHLGVLCSDACGLASETRP